MLRSCPASARCRLRELSPDAITTWRAGLARDGLGVESQRKALKLIRGVLQRAVEWRRISVNPARLVRLPPPEEKGEVRPLPPELVEAIRSHFLADNRRLDATLVAVLAYAGLRPQEAHALCWHHVRQRTLLVEQRVANGVIRRSTKTRQNRTVRLLGPVAQDLLEFRMWRGNPDANELVFPGAAGKPWGDSALGNWKARAFRPAREAAAVGSATPYTLRHSFASLLIWEGRPITYVAAQLGPSPAMTLRTYAHVFEEFEDAERTSADEAIRLTRGKLVPAQYLSERHS
jgi:integrase